MTLQPVATAPVIALPSVGLSDDEKELIKFQVQRLSMYETANRLKADYYDGTHVAALLGIAIPPSMANLSAVAGWPGTTVDVLEERLDWYGWATDGDDFGLGEVYAQNALDVEGSLATLDALIYGTAFAVVGSGEDDEPSPLITLHSPRSMTGIWDARRRRLEAAFSLVEGSPRSEAALYLPDQTVYLTRDGDVYGTGQWKVSDRDQHNLGRVPVAQFVNRDRASDRGGRSEISPAVRYYTDNAVRTLMAMEVHREFYQAPQRWVMGADASQFVNPDGSQMTGLQAIMGHVWAIPRDGNDELPQVGQFQPASPTPYIDQIKTLAQLLAAEAAIPPSYLGFQTDNPASADAIQRSEARLVKRAERRQASFGRAWLEVGRLALLIRDGEVPDTYSAVTAKWRDAATPTRSAAADEAVKLSSGDDPIIPRDSQVLYDRIGLDPAEQRQLAADKRRQAGTTALQAIAEAARRTVTDADAGAGTPPSG